MRLALYHPELGYYRRGRSPIGAAGDYFTSPAAHPLFGALIARQLRQMWRLLGRPRPFTVLEPGAGSGELAVAVGAFAAAVAPDFAAALAYRPLELGAALPDAFEGCIVSNELFDALPFHRVEVRDDALRELYVDWQDDQLVERAGPPSTPALGAYFDRLGVWPPEGSQAEIGLEAAELMDRFAASLRRGYVLTFDYGYPAEELYGVPRPRGTLLCYYRHTYNEEPLRRPGEQDITAHVDFSTLALAGAARGLEAVELFRQRDFLRNCGLDAYLAALAHARLASEVRAANRHAALALVDPRGLGRFGVLVQARAAPAAELIGLTGDDARADFERCLPLAGAEHTPLYAALRPVDPKLRWEDFLPPVTPADDR
jgi:SAM-dependent MidA family methyltransferase